MSAAAAWPRVSAVEHQRAIGEVRDAQVRRSLRDERPERRVGPLGLQMLAFVEHEEHVTRARGDQQRLLERVVGATSARSRAADDVGEPLASTASSTERAKRTGRCRRRRACTTPSCRAVAAARSRRTARSCPNPRRAHHSGREFTVIEQRVHVRDQLLACECATRNGRDRELQVSQRGSERLRAWLATRGVSEHHRPAPSVDTVDRPAAWTPRSGEHPVSVAPVSPASRRKSDSSWRITPTRLG